MEPLRWPAEAIWEAVAPSVPGFSVEVLPQVDSTNSELMRRAHAGLSDPVLLVAEQQSAGRGRLGRSWLAEHAALTFSLGMALAPLDWSGLSLAVGLALAESLHRGLQLKWPNDLWWQERKLGGILIETASVRGARYAVVGVGINIAVPTAEGLRTAPAGLCELLPGVDAAQALQRIALPLVQTLQRFEAYGFAPLQNAFQARDALYGRELLCSDGSSGTGRGVDAQGALLLHGAQGVRKITSAEVSVRPIR